MTSNLFKLCVILIVRKILLIRHLLCNYDWIRTNSSFTIKSVFQLNLCEVPPTNGLIIIWSRDRIRTYNLIRPFTGCTSTCASKLMYLWSEGIRTLCLWLHDFNQTTSRAAALFNCCINLLCYFHWLGNVSLEPTFYSCLCFYFKLPYY